MHVAPSSGSSTLPAHHRASSDRPYTSRRPCGALHAPWIQLRIFDSKLEIIVSGLWMIVTFSNGVRRSIHRSRNRSRQLQTTSLTFLSAGFRLPANHFKSRCGYIRLRRR